MARFRLRYQSTDLEMPDGDFVVGRSSSCHLALDDALVSRRHAVFHVSESRRRGRGPRQSQRRRGQRRGASRAARAQAPRSHRHRRAGAPAGAGPRARARPSAVPPHPRGDDPGPAGPGRQGHAEEQTVHRSESVLDRIADKALALGRYDEAERMLGRRLKDMLSEVRTAASGSRRSAALRRDQLRAQARRRHPQGGVARLGLPGTRRDCGRLLDADAIGRLHDLVRRIRYPGSKALKQLPRAPAGERGQAHPEPALLAAASRGHRAHRRRLSASPPTRGPAPSADQELLEARQPRQVVARSRRRLRLVPGDVAVEGTRDLGKGGEVELCERSITSSASIRP